MTMVQWWSSGVMLRTIFNRPTPVPRDQRYPPIPEIEAPQPDYAAQDYQVAIDPQAGTALDRMA